MHLECWFAAEPGPTPTDSGTKVADKHESSPVATDSVPRESMEVVTNVSSDAQVGAFEGTI